MKNYIFTAGTLSLLLKELSGHYRKPKERFSSNRYWLRISQDEHTTVSIDSPPKTLDPLLNTRIRYLSLDIATYDPIKNINFTVYHGSDSVHNSIRLHGEDEDWVNLTHAKLLSLLGDVEPQSTFFRRYRVPLFFCLALTLGWVLDQILSHILVVIGQSKLVPWTWTLFWQHLWLSAMLGVGPAGWLLSVVGRAYPSIEIQTGSPRSWHEARLRQRLKVILAIAIVGPSADLLYDIYKAIVGA